MILTGLQKLNKFQLSAHSMKPSMQKFKAQRFSSSGIHVYTMPSYKKSGLENHISY